MYEGSAVAYKPQDPKDHSPAMCICPFRCYSSVKFRSISDDPGEKLKDIIGAYETLFET